ncbi:hypothetical protein DUGA2_62780 [Duganella sp. HH101]|nr:hypothetical protein DUGA2_62780 [Duganella sp. HH101]
MAFKVAAVMAFAFWSFCTNAAASLLSVTRCE